MAKEQTNPTTDTGFGSSVLPILHAPGHRGQSQEVQTLALPFSVWCSLRDPDAKAPKDNQTFGSELLRAPGCSTGPHSHLTDLSLAAA